jgi:SAM-dependent methyltransferase
MPIGSAAVAELPLTPAQKAERAASFGGVASEYERYRPRPAPAAVDWILPSRVRTAVDLGAGTGALARLLVDRADRVVAVEPDDRMRVVLAESVPGVEVLAGRGEAIPLADASADAVVASTSWHWMEPVTALREVGRVLVPGGTLGALWSGPDPDSGLMAQAQALLTRDGTPDGEGGAALARALDNPHRPAQVLEIPPGLPFDAPEHTVVRWDVAVTADQLIGLLGTFSWVILMDQTSRSGVFGAARRLLQAEGVEGDVTVDMGYRSDAWRARRRS